jgi:CspA family cold shock protein
MAGMRLTGVIKVVKEKEGFGFIAENGVDYFFHRSEVGGSQEFVTLRQGQAVTFTPAVGEKGKRALDVQVWVERVPPGPVSMFRNKVRKPVTLTLTPDHHVRLEHARRRLQCSRADLIALLIDQYAEAVQRHR